MQFLFVTGMSGAGKSQAANALEDIGYYCVDNMPPKLIPAFADLSVTANSGFERLAIVTDIRGGSYFSEIDSILDGLEKRKVDYKILFLDSSDEVIMRRYKENRRKHPLCADDNVTVYDAIHKERTLLKKLRMRADIVLDTSNLSVIQLKQQLSTLFFGNDNNGFSVRCMSFGYKYGPCNDADIMLDVRCLPNPYYVADLKEHTGLENCIKDFVMDSENSRQFLKKLLDFIDFSLPLYQSEGKSQLVIAVGCTGGKHRSVTFAELINEHLLKEGYNSVALHRDINK